MDRSGGYSDRFKKHNGGRIKMKVHLEEDGILIVPETEFEEEVLEDLFPATKIQDPHTAFIKTGTTPAEIVGLRVVSGVKK